MNTLPPRVAKALLLLVLLVLLAGCTGGTGQYLDGVTDGRRLTFTRRWLNQGHLFSQDYPLELDASGGHATGSFFESHAPGPRIDFAMERGWEPVVGTK